MISRRDFLRAAGIAALACNIPGWLPDTDPVLTPSFDPLYGRVLTLDAGVPMNAILPIAALLPETYLTPVGELERAWLQPMLTPAVYRPTLYDPPFAAEVTGALAPLRRYCSSHAEVEYWIGHGGVLHVVDRLEYDGIVWYGVQQADEPQVYWTQSAPLTPLTLPPAVADLTIRVNRADFRLTAFQRDRALFSVPYAAGSDEILTAGAFAVREHQYARFDPPKYQASTVLTLRDDLHIGGAYWHNRFGENVAGHAIQLPPYVAKWLYGAASDSTRVMIT